jgi:surfactin synthase thioesterase subunit
MNTLVENTIGQLKNWLDVPYLLFGHSFGAVVAFELARRLRGLAVRPPLRLAVSGRRAPSTGSSSVLHLLPDSQLEARIRAFGGTPAVILDDPELRALFLSLIRADFKALETHVFEASERLDLPLSVFCGDADPEAPARLMRPWLEESSGPSSFHSLPGGHFFALERPAAVVQLLLEELSQQGLQGDPRNLPQ